MVYEPVMILNGLSQSVVAIVSLLLAIQLKKEKKYRMKQPFYFLTGAFLVAAMLNFAWFFGLIKISSWDSMIIGPLFNLIILGVWFYTGMLISGHRHLYYLIPLIMMSANAFILFSEMYFLCDIITGLVLISVFFHLGFIDHHLVKRMSYIGLVYGIVLSSVSIFAYLNGTQYTNTFWFIPNIIAIYLIYMINQKSQLQSHLHTEKKHHVPVIVEVGKLGLFVIGLSIFLMLGTLGVHELGHSVFAKAFGCSHDTVFYIGHAITHVTCDNDAGAIPITLGGIILTLIIALLIYITGNAFARDISYLITGFSIITAVDDFTVLGIPHSVIFMGVIIAAIVIVHGLVKIVKSYEIEYELHEASAYDSYPRKHYLN